MITAPLVHAHITTLHPNSPLYVRTQNPLYLQFLGMPMESPQTLWRDQFELQLSTVFSNIFEYDPVGITQTNIDMELWRSTISLLYGLTDNTDVRIDLTTASNGGGFLDGFIQWYHNALGVSNGGKEYVDDNIYTFQVVQNGTTLADYSHSNLALSDTVVRVKHIFDIPESWNIPLDVALAAYLKLPTGSSTHGFTSTRPDAGLSLFLQKVWTHWALTTQLGGVLIDPNTNLEPLLKHGFLAVGQSVEYKFTDAFSLVAQLSGNTALFKQTDNEDLSKMALDLNVGVAGTMPCKHFGFDEFFYQWSFGEDILSAGPSVDFSVLFLGGIRF